MCLASPIRIPKTAMLKRGGLRLPSAGAASDLIANIGESHCARRGSALARPGNSKTDSTATAPRAPLLRWRIRILGIG